MTHKIGLTTHASEEHNEVKEYYKNVSARQESNLLIAGIHFEER